MLSSNRMNASLSASLFTAMIMPEELKGPGAIGGGILAYNMYGAVQDFLRRKEAEKYFAHLDMANKFMALVDRNKLGCLLPKEYAQFDPIYWNSLIGTSEEEKFDIDYSESIFNPNFTPSKDKLLDPKYIPNHLKGHFLKTYNIFKRVSFSENTNPRTKVLAFAFLRMLDNIAKRLKANDESRISYYTAQLLLKNIEQLLQDTLTAELFGTTNFLGVRAGTAEFFLTGNDTSINRLAHGERWNLPTKPGSEKKYTSIYEMLELSSNECGEIFDETSIPEKLSQQTNNLELKANHLQRIFLQHHAGNISEDEVLNENGMREISLSNSTQQKIYAGYQELLYGSKNILDEKEEFEFTLKYKSFDDAYKILSEKAKSPEDYRIATFFACLYIIKQQIVCQYDIAQLIIDMRKKDADNLIIVLDEIFHRFNKQIPDLIANLNPIFEIKTTGKPAKSKCDEPCKKLTRSLADIFNNAVSFNPSTYLQESAETRLETLGKTIYRIKNQLGDDSTDKYKKILDDQYAQAYHELYGIAFLGEPPAYKEDNFDPLNSYHVTSNSQTLYDVEGLEIKSFDPEPIILIKASSTKEEPDSKNKIECLAKHIDSEDEFDQAFTETIEFVFNNISDIKLENKEEIDEPYYYFGQSNAEIITISYKLFDTNRINRQQLNELLHLVDNAQQNISQVPQKLEKTLSLFISKTQNSDITTDLTSLIVPLEIINIPQWILERNTEDEIFKLKFHISRINQSINSFNEHILNTLSPHFEVFNRISKLYYEYIQLKIKFDKSLSCIFTNEKDKHEREMAVRTLNKSTSAYWRESSLTLTEIQETYAPLFSPDDLPDSQDFKKRSAHINKSRNYLKNIESKYTSPEIYIDWWENKNPGFQQQIDKKTIDFVYSIIEQQSWTEEQKVDFLYKFISNPNIKENLTRFRNSLAKKNAAAWFMQHKCRRIGDAIMYILGITLPLNELVEGAIERLTVTNLTDAQRSLASLGLASTSNFNSRKSLYRNNGFHIFSEERSVRFKEIETRQVEETCRRYCTSTR